MGAPGAGEPGRRHPWHVHAVQIPAVVVLLIMMLQVVANAVMRTFATPITGTLEVTRYWFLPILVMLGLIAAERHEEHIAVVLMFERFPDSLQRVLNVTLYLLGTAICLAIAYFTLQEAREAVTIRLTGGVTGTPIWWVVCLVPVAFLAFAATYLANLRRYVATLPARPSPREYADRAEP